MLCPGIPLLCREAEPFLGLIICLSPVRPAEHELPQIRSGAHIALTGRPPEPGPGLPVIPAHADPVAVPDSEPVLCVRIAVLRGLTALLCRAGFLRGVLPGLARGA